MEKAHGARAHDKAVLPRLHLGLAHGVEDAGKGLGEGHLADIGVVLQHHHTTLGKVRVNRQIFRKGAVGADLLPAQLLKAGGAALALAAADVGGADDLLAHKALVHVLAGFHDLAAELMAQNAGRGEHPVALLIGLDISAAKAAAKDLHQVLVRIDLGLFHFFHGDLTDAAIHNCLHCFLPPIKISSRLIRRGRSCAAS